MLKSVIHCPLKDRALAVVCDYLHHQHRHHRSKALLSEPQTSQCLKETLFEPLCSPFSVCCHAPLIRPMARRLLCLLERLILFLGPMYNVSIAEDHSSSSSFCLSPLPLSAPHVQGAHTTISPSPPAADASGLAHSSHIPTGLTRLVVSAVPAPFVYDLDEGEDSKHRESAGRH